MQANSNQGSRPAKAETAETGADEWLQLETWLPYRLFRISSRVADVLGAFYGPKYGLSRAAWRTMAIVANRPGISVKEICQAGGLDQFAVSRAIRQLVELGFAQRQTGKSDRRYAAIELSETGWSAYGEISQLSRRIHAELTGSITDEELAVLDVLLAKLDNASAGVLARGWHGVMDSKVSGRSDRS